MHMRHIFIWDLPHSTIFFHIILLMARLKKKLLNIKCVFWFSLQLLSETFLILRRYERDVMINVHWSSLTYPLALPDFNETWIFLTDFQKILKYQISWKSVQWQPSCSIQMERRTDRHDEVNSRFSLFCKHTYRGAWLVLEC